MTDELIERPAKKPKLPKSKDEESKQKSTAVKSLDDSLPPPPPRQKKTDSSPPSLQRSNAILGELLAGISTAALTKILGGTLQDRKKDTKYSSTILAKKKNKSSEKILKFKKSANLIIQQLQASLDLFDLEHTKKLQENLIDIYLKLDELRSTLVYKNEKIHVRNIDAIMDKIRKYADGNYLNLPKTIREQQAEEEEVTDVEEEQQQMGQVSINV